MILLTAHDPWFPIPRGCYLLPLIHVLPMRFTPIQTHLLNYIHTLAQNKRIVTRFLGMRSEIILNIVYPINPFSTSKKWPQFASTISILGDNLFLEDNRCKLQYRDIKPLVPYASKSVTVKVKTTTTSVLGNQIWHNS